MSDILTYDKLLKAKEMLESQKVDISEWLTPQQIYEMQKRNLIKTDVEQNIHYIIQRGVMNAVNKLKR